MTKESSSTSPSLPQKSEPSEELAKLHDLLTPQERLFCHEYLVDFNHRRAADKVGLSPNSGIRFLRKPLITQYIKHLTDELAHESIITRDMVQYELVHEYLPRAKGDVPVHGVDRDGVQFEAKITNMAAYGKAIDLMAKHSGFTVPEVVRGGLTININHEALGITIEGECEDGTESSS